MAEALKVATAEFDFASKWPRQPDWSDFRLEGAGATAVAVTTFGATIVNGDIAAALAQRPDLPEPVGWPDIVSGDAYAIRLACDRMLAVGGVLLSPGWYENGFAVSDASDSFIVFELSGPNAGDILAHGGEVSVGQPSASAARLLFGVFCILYRYQDPDRFRLMVPRPQAGGFLSWLSDAITPLAG